jgi:hypothetical protein
MGYPRVDSTNTVGGLHDTPTIAQDLAFALVFLARCKTRSTNWSSDGATAAAAAVTDGVPLDAIMLGLGYSPTSP